MKKLLLSIVVLTFFGQFQIYAGENLRQQIAEETFENGYGLAAHT